MGANILNFPCEIDREQLLKNLHIKPDTHFVEEVDRLIAQAKEIGKPKATYKVAYVESKGDDYAVVEGIKFTSRVLRVNLEEAYKIVPYVVTCGTELEEWAQGIDGMFEQFCADGIMEAALRSARHRFSSKVDEELNWAHASSMNPGSLGDWPIKEQKPLFQLLGDVRSSIGVDLKESFLMSPIKTVSGIRFPKEGSYENCQLCPREKCPGRRAPYDKNLYAEKYQQK